VRQLVDVSNGVGAGRAYEPFGDNLVSTGVANSVYGFTGEWADATELVYLRARYYQPTQGRFISKDAWDGDIYSPMTGNMWLYGLSNPINLTDPSGKYPIDDDPDYDPSWHCYWIEDVHARDACLMQYCKEPLLPWRRDEGYNQNADAILGWGAIYHDSAGTQHIDNPKRIENARKVYDWICETGGWWGARQCPDPKKLGGWILNNEVGELLNQGVYNWNSDKKVDMEGILNQVVGFIRADLAKPKIEEALARQTSFFNPVLDGVFNSMDWDKLTSRSWKPPPVAEMYINRFWDSGTWTEYDYKKLFWWEPWEPEFKNVQPEWTTYELNSDKDVLLHFARVSRSW
ncbi:MAG: RHS repeat-associated core domain-containing protein, partial [Chloroflexota bacterium]|nr:RHS repeat-associated core domain-containing protein [Chloroflexota bacterium]